jgi:phosphatidylinositol glycan class K
MKARIRCDYFIFCLPLVHGRIPDALLQHENDNEIGVAVIDTFTHYVLEFMEGVDKTSQTSMQDLVRLTLLISTSMYLPRRGQFDTYDPHKIHSHPGVGSRLFGRRLNETLITDFFGGVAHVDVLSPSAESVVGVGVQPSISRETQDHGRELQDVKPSTAFGHRPRETPINDNSDARSRMGRVWASIGIVGLLIGYVVMCGGK